MKIDLTGIAEKRNRKKVFEVPSMVFDEVDETDAFELSVSNIEGKNLSITGESGAKLKRTCDRCLSDVVISVPVVLDLKVSIENGQISNDSEDPVLSIEDGILNVDEWLRGELMLNAPSKVLCKEDCKGICPKCGQNLNLSDCGCDRSVLDPRMARFIDVFSEFKEV